MSLHIIKTLCSPHKQHACTSDLLRATSSCDAVSWRHNTSCGLGKSEAVSPDKISRPSSVSSSLWGVVEGDISVHGIESLTRVLPLEVNQVERSHQGPEALMHAALGTAAIQSNCKQWVQMQWEHVQLDSSWFSMHMSGISD